MKFFEINTRAIKKALDAKRCKYVYHNKNNGGGNFGIMVILSHGLDGFDINGRYRSDGEIYRLSFNKFLSKMIDIKSCTLEELIEQIKEHIKNEGAKNEE